jgi:hypothetical protein
MGTATIELPVETPETVKVANDPAKKAKMPPASYIRNKSRYSDAEVNRLIEFAAGEIAGGAYGLNLRKTCINVKNSNRGSGSGGAYDGVPRISNAPRGAEYLVTLKLGPENSFPTDNVHSKWVKVDADTPGAQRLFKTTGGKLYQPGGDRSEEGVNGHHGWFILVKQDHAYGGKGSPVMEYRDWRERLVALAAHELSHIYQFQNELPKSEVVCETKASKALAAYRNLGTPVIEMAAD